MNRTLIIGEPGCTHQGDYDTLVRLIQTAKDCGADVVKPQWTSDPALMCERRHIGLDHPKRAYYERAYGWLNFPVEWHADLSAMAHLIGLQYACTVFLPQDVATIAPFVEYLKIASFEVEDEAMFTAWLQLSARPEPLLSEAGGQSDAWWEDGKRPHGLRLHCISAYPAPISAMNLACLHRDEWERAPYVGLSDHSRRLSTGALAVAAGAEIVETHYRLDDCDPENPDYAVAFTPAEFATYIQNIRDAELMLGDGEKQLQPCEAEMAQYRVG